MGENHDAHCRKENGEGGGFQDAPERHLSAAGPKSVDAVHDEWHEGRDREGVRDRAHERCQPVVCADARERKCADHQQARGRGCHDARHQYQDDDGTQAIEAARFGTESQDRPGAEHRLGDVRDVLDRDLRNGHFRQLREEVERQDNEQVDPPPLAPCEEQGGEQDGVRRPQG